MCACIEKDLQDAGPCCSKVCVIHGLFPLLHWINYNFLIDFLVPILWQYTRHEQCLPITSGGTFVKHMLRISNSIRTSGKIHASGLHFFLSLSPGRPKSESRTLFGGKQRSSKAAKGGGRSAPLWVFVSLKRQVRVAHGRVARPKPDSHIYNRKEFIPEPFLAWSLARI